MPPPKPNYQNQPTPTTRVLLLFVVLVCMAGMASGQSGWYDVVPLNGKYQIPYTQTPEPLVSSNAAANSNAAFQWQSAPSPDDGSFTNIAGATSANLSFSAPITGVVFYRRLSTVGSLSYTSNIIRLEAASANTEDLNYTRSHSVLVPAKTTWQQVDALPIGDKLVSTTYMDGLGRPIQQVSTGVATPASPGGTWGDVVQHSEYDNFGRSPKQFLPYTTTTNAGKYKPTALNEQGNYYNSKYPDPVPFSQSPFSQATYDESPLNRVINMKLPGQAWASSAGSSAKLLLNTGTDNVQRFTIDYASTAKPVKAGVYAANTLLKSIGTDEQGLQVINYSNSLGQLILKKVQLSASADDGPGSGHSGWICTYYVYDDYGQLRCEIPAEAVKWLEPNNWDFTAANGQTVFDEQCFVYQYDEKGRTTSKKSPGVQALYMLYDSRDRVVFMQDGNQRLKSPAEWTVNLYDELDRVVMTTLYRTNETTTQLQTLINNAATSTTVTIANPGGLQEDLAVNAWTAGTTRYAATKTVTLNDGFESGTGAEFTMETDPTATSATITTTTTTHKNPLTAAQLAGANCTILKYLYYDDYSQSSAKTFDQAAATAAAQYPAGPTVQPITPTARTTGMPTGSLTRVLNSAQFLSSTVYYDEDGQPIQSLDQNITLGYDIATSQYGWDGRLLATHSRHAMPGGAMDGYAIKTKYNFDKIGRTTSTEKTFGSNAPRTIASYAYDDMGRLKTKVLDPNYTNATTGKNGMETLDYSYDIQGQITGINKDYALKTQGLYQKWGNYFGLYLAYDKTTANGQSLFTTSKLSGQITGMVWNTQGDDAQRKYDYQYDNAGRLIKANYTERQTTFDSWINTKLDFSVKGQGSNQTIEYDLVGNLKSMMQMGFQFGNANPVMVDDLRYAYFNFSNKLKSVTDATTATSINGTQGDFKDGTNSGDDYLYDDNGNLITDYNKNLTNLSGTRGITYNYLDKPEEIKIEGKGTIKITYDADGTKLRRTFTPATGTAVKITTYINEYTYEEVDGVPTGFGPGISFEEGRIRPIQPSNQSNGLETLIIGGSIDLPDGKKGAFDYYLRDYQANVRMILTDEVHSSQGTATLEVNRQGQEQPAFGNFNNLNVTTEPAWTANTTQVSKLSASGKKIGPATLLKVMAGDEISAKTDYFYLANPNSPGGESNLSPLLTSLGLSITGSGLPDNIKNATTAITNQFGPGSALALFTNPNSSQTGVAPPKAYLNIIFYDERFNFVSEGSEALRVTTPGNGQLLVAMPRKAPKNGYCYVYVSNSSDQPVSFDNVVVKHDRARIIEENHYYSYGLKIAAISSTKLADVLEGNVKNAFLYQGDYSEFDDDLGWNDFELRTYEAQIGRWLQPDP